VSSLRSALKRETSARFRSRWGGTGCRPLATDQCVVVLDTPAALHNLWSSIFQHAERDDTVRFSACGAGSAPRRCGLSSINSEYPVQLVHNLDHSVCPRLRFVTYHRCSRSTWSDTAILFLPHRNKRPSSTCFVKQLLFLQAPAAQGPCGANGVNWRSCTMEQACAQ
jgi:hypothetical protein